MDKGPEKPTRAPSSPATNPTAGAGAWSWVTGISPLPTAQIIGPRPPLPQPRTRSTRSLTLYSSELQQGRGQSFFGTMQPGIQIEAICELFVVREVSTQKRRQPELPIRHAPPA